MRIEIEISEQRHSELIEYSKKIGCTAEQFIEKAIKLQVKRIEQEEVQTTLLAIMTQNCPKCDSEIQSTNLSPPDSGTVYGCTKCEWSDYVC